MSIPLAVLHVEDVVDDHLLVLRALQQGGYDVKAKRCETPAQMRAALAAQPWDIILCDHKLPHFDSFGALGVLEESGLDLPFIIVSGSIVGEVAVEAMRVGAQDFIFKDNLTRLVPAIQRELREAEGRRDRKRAERALRASEARFKTMFEEAPLGIALIDSLTGCIRDLNPRFAEIAGRPMQEMENIDWMTITHPEDVQADADQMALLNAGKIGGYRMEKRYLHPDGTPVWIYMTIAPLKVEDQANPYHLCMIEDITERKQSEQQIQSHLRRLAALRAIDVAISSTFDLRVTLAFLLQQVTLQLGVDAAAILLLDRDIQELKCAADQGFRGRGIKHLRLRLGQDYAGQAALERRSIYLPNIGLGQATFSNPELTREEGFVAYFAVPLIAKGRVKGVLEIFNRSALDPDSDWTDFLETLAGQTAIAVDNAELFADLQQSNAEMQMAYDRTIEGWSRAMDLRDKETEGHTLRVADMTMELARKMQVKESDLAHVRRGALLHDMGKLGVPDSILLKPDKLTDEEWVIMRKHPTYAYEMLSPIAYLKPAMDIPYCHHEKWDGTGYPRGLKGEQIPLAARIFAVNDVYDALTSDRPYREAWPKEKTLQHIRAGSGTHFDPKVTDAFLNMIAEERRP